MTPQGTIIKGYKATDEDIKCRGYQFTPGQWHEHDGPVKLFQSGFHFCTHASGPWAYHCHESTRIWEVEAELVEMESCPGADLKYVAKRIRLVKEVLIGGDLNTGHYNTGDGNTGHYNAGNRNTGNYNTGDGNTGHYNAGNRNTGNYNTGNHNTGDLNTGNQNAGYLNTGNHNTGNYNTGNINTGDYNTGYYNTGNQNAGYRNTGYRNTGDLNTGDYNTGNRNTGDGNVGAYHSGSLCFGDPVFYMFNKPANRANVNWSIVNQVASAIQSDDAFDITPEMLALPNASVEVIRELHAAHKAARAKIAKA